MRLTATVQAAFYHFSVIIELLCTRLENLNPLDSFSHLGTFFSAADETEFDFPLLKALTVDVLSTSRREGVGRFCASDRTFSARGARIEGPLKAASKKAKYKMEEGASVS